MPPPGIFGAIIGRIQVAIRSTPTESSSATPLNGSRPISTAIESSSARTWEILPGHSPGFTPSATLSRTTYNCWNSDAGSRL
jgi:hypothetical protein